MKVSKWGDSLAIRIPQDVATALGLKEGDDVDICAHQPAMPQPITDPLKRAQAMERIRSLAVPLPEGYKFDREESNAR